MLPIKAPTTKQIIIGLGIIGGIVAIVKGRSIYNNYKTKRESKKFDKQTKVIDGKVINPVEIARQLGMDLGTAYPSWNPLHWTENDNAVIKLLLTVPKNLMGVVSQNYNKLYKENLQADCQRLLDSDYSKVRHLFV